MAHTSTITATTSPRFDGAGGSGVENWSCVRSSIFSPPNKSVQHFSGCTQTANTGNSNYLKDLPLSRRFGVDVEPGMEKLPIRGRNCAVPPRNSEREQEPGRHPTLHCWPLAG